MRTVRDVTPMWDLLVQVAAASVPRVAVLVASKDGAATIADTVTSATAQCDVFVVSDGSTDATCRIAGEAGATVLELPENIGKPAAIYRAVRDLGLLDAYTFLAILDDDTTLAPDFIEQALTHMTRDRRDCAVPYDGVHRRSGERRLRDEALPVTKERRSGGVVITVGKTITNWTHDLRWNPWVGARAYSYWRYQVTIRPGQDVFNALNCISGSNSVYRTSVLREVLVEKTPYIVDDTYWVLETQRKGLGRVRYAPRADAFIQDPTNGRDWYKQNLRWLWGTGQGILGHRVGRQKSWFDFWYASLMLDWAVYILLWPVLVAVLIIGDFVAPQIIGLAIVSTYLAWTSVAAVALRQWRLLVLIPFLIAYDWLYRVNFVHAMVKAIRQPTVESCTWDSPKRHVEERG